MQATRGFQSGRQKSVNSAKSSAHWRSEDREKLTFAANGLLADIWSYCADQGTDRLSTTAMRMLTASDQKNAGRMLSQLAAAGFIEATPTGWRVTEVAR